jgi:hypothetical protein
MITMLLLMNKTSKRKEVSGKRGDKKEGDKKD